MSKIDPELKKKLLKETQTPFKGLRRILWIAFSGSAFLGLIIMLSQISSGSEFQQNKDNGNKCFRKIIYLLPCVETIFLYPDLHY